MTAIELDLTLWPRQREAFESQATEILFGGASSGGKSHFARVVIIACSLLVPGLQSRLIRKKYADIITNHVEGATGFRAMLKPLIDRGLVSITKEGIKFPKGSVCTFQHCQDERQFDSAQGIETQLLVVEEATQISERLIRVFRAWVRMSETLKANVPDVLKDKLPWILYTANPVGQSVGFFRRNFVKARRAGQIELVDGFKRQYIPSLIADNKSIDAETGRQRLSGIGDSGLARALMEGDWDSPIGEFYPEWDESRHVIDDFNPALCVPHWYQYRGFDWGTADPAYCAWACVSDGEPFHDEQGRKRWYPRGAVIVFDEWHIADPENPARGLRLRNKDMALGIVERSDINYRKVVTLTDSKPFQDTGGDGPAKTFEENGVPLTHADTSRVAGWSALRSMLIGEIFNWESQKRIPMIYFCTRCAAAREYIPTLPRHPREDKRDDAAEHGEATHTCDTIRLMALAHNRKVVKDRVDPTTEKVQKLLSAKPNIKGILKNHGIRL